MTAPATPLDLLVRSFSDVELRAANGGRTLVGIACPFDRVIDLGRAGYEVMRRGAFARTIAERGAGRVKVLSQHNDRVNPIGRATLLREEPAGLYAELRLSQTQAADEVLELVRDGCLDSLSIGFIGVKHVEHRGRTEDGRPLLERTEVALREVSVVNFPAYPDARITAVRAAVLLDPSLDHARRRAALAAALSGVPRV